MWPVLAECGRPKWMTPFGSPQPCPLDCKLRTPPPQSNITVGCKELWQVLRRQFYPYQGTPLSSHRVFGFLAAAGAEPDPVAPQTQAEKGARMKMKAFQVLLLSGVSPQGEPILFSSHHYPDCRHPHVVGALTFLPPAPGERRWACKHLKLEPAGQPSFSPPLPKPQSWRPRGDRRHSLRETSHILSFPRPVQAPSCHGDAAALRCNGCRRHGCFQGSRPRVDAVWPRRPGDRVGRVGEEREASSRLSW